MPGTVLAAVNGAENRQAKLSALTAANLRLTAGVSSNAWRKRWFSTRDDVAPGGHVATSGDTFGCYN